MTTRNPDRFTLQEMQDAWNTVEQMDRCGCDVISECQKCGLRLHVNLKGVIAARGPKFSLWNRATRCKKVGCGGSAIFLAMARRGSFHQRIDNPFQR